MLADLDISIEEDQQIIIGIDDGSITEDPDAEPAPEEQEQEAAEEDSGFSMSDFNSAVEVAATKNDMTGYRLKVNNRIDTYQARIEAIETAMEIKIYLKANQNEVKVVQTSIEEVFSDDLNYQVSFEVDKH